MRFFEKISFAQFKIDVSNDKSMYDSYELPRRGSKNLCGYDFFSINDIVLRPGEIVKIPTGYKAKFMEDEALLLVVRSSMGFKANIRMCNQVGVIDSDYYGNTSNEGHIWVALKNEGDKDYIIKKGDAYCQGIFVKYLTVDDGSVDSVRIGGIDSTNKESE